MPTLKFIFTIILMSCSLLTTKTRADTVDFSPPFQTPQLTNSQGDFGGIGLMQMPSARMAEEGEFSFSYNHNNEYDFYTLSLQLMPWFETVIRYTLVEDVLYSSYEDYSGDTRYTDKGIDTKVRLWKESQWLPDVSVGFRDLGGTGLFDGEFIAATKSFSTNNYGQFDFTLGVGWGYFGTRGNIANPLCTAADHFCNRISGYADNGGSIDYNRWFTGPTSLFGGIEYQTLYAPLSLKLEYDGNDYSSDFPVTRSGVDMTPKTPWNFGAVYALNDNASIRLSYERGTTLSLGFTLSTNFDTLKTPWFDDPIPTLDTNQPNTLDEVDWNKLDHELSNVAGYNTEKVYIEEGNMVSLVANQTKYRDRDIAAERAAAVLINHLPKSIESYKITETQKNLPVKSTQISAQAYRKAANVEYFNADIKDALLQLPAEIKGTEPVYDTFEPFSAGFSPHLTQSFGSPEAFYIYSLNLDGGASYWFNPNLELSSSISINLVDNLDEFNYVAPPDGTSNYRVRTLLRAYVRNNDAYLNNLQLTWFQKYGQNIYHQVYGGYLETMFAGVGSEVLYRKPNSNWAIGADFNAISQRDPDSWLRTFSHEDDYGSNAKVLADGTTGYLSLYYQPEFSLLENTLLKIHAGKFLATDKGVRIDFSKQYKSGMIVGAYASITDLSAEEFGEGSFTKGFYLSIPFDAISLKPTTSRGGIGWQPITRDGGQMLSRRYNLFNITDMVSPWFQRPNQNN